ncbi:MAG: TIGR01777 family oxidoreductase [Calditrichaceae bacterium]
MKVIIAGGTGFIGRYLSEFLNNSGHDVIILSRNPKRAKYTFTNKIKCLLWNDFDFSAWQDELESTKIIINLIGENIGQWPWTNQLKHKILYSRIHAGQTIVQAIHHAKNKPRLLIQASATGYYGDNSKDKLTEESKSGKGFLADVCRQWENSTIDVESIGVKRSIIRVGPVLGRNGGILKKMSLPFKLFVGGPIGSGNQKLPWIHIDDLVEAILFIINNKKTQKIFNLCTPKPITMNTFARTLGKTLKRPSIFKVPEFIVKLIFGEMGRETILSGQNALPKVLIKSNFKYKYSDLPVALSNLLQ